MNLNQYGLELFRIACKELGNIQCPVMIHKIKDWECYGEKSCDDKKNKSSECWKIYISSKHNKEQP